MHRKCLQQSSSTHRKEGKLTCKPAIHVEVRNCTLCCFYARILMLPAIIGAISITIYKSHRCLWCTIFFPQQCYLIKISIPVTSAQNKGRNALTFYKVFFFFFCQLKYYVTIKWQYVSITEHHNGRHKHGAYLNGTRTSSYASTNIDLPKSSLPKFPI